MNTPSTAPRAAPRDSRTLGGSLTGLPARLRAELDGIDWGADRDPRAVRLLCVLLVAVGAFLMYVGRGETFFYDDWAYVVEKFGGGIHSLLVPHNEHFSLIPIAIYKVLFHLVGINHYQVFRLVLVVFHLGCAALIYDLAQRRIGAWPALVAAAAILCLFAAWQNLIWAFQMSFVGSVLGGLAAWALIDRNTRACDIAACGAVAFALCCSGLGLPFVPGIAVELLWRRQPRRLWLVAAPFALYVLWYTQYGVSMVTSASIVASPQWIMNMAAAGVGALVGRDVDWGIPLSVVALTLAARRFVGGANVSPRLVGAVLTALTFWVLTGISRSLIQAPDESRYAYLSAVVVVVIAVELAPAVRFTGRAVGVGAVIVAVSAVMGWQTLHANAGTLRSDGQTIAAQLGGLQIVGDYAAPTYAPNPALAPNITAGPYLHTARAMRSYAGDSPATLLHEPAPLQTDADLVMLQVLNPMPEPSTRSPSGAPPRLDNVVAASVVRSGSCVTLTPLGPTALVDATLPPGGVLLRDHGKTPMIAALRRFAPTFLPISGSIVPRQSDALILAPDSAPSVPWHVQVGLLSPLSICTLP
jgi:hypothetical protein